MRFWRLFRYWLMQRAVGKYGVGAPVLADRNGAVLDGNRRTLAARRHGIEMIPVVLVDAEVVWMDPNDLTITCAADLEENLDEG